MTAPAMAIKKLRISNPVTEPSPIAEPIKPPITAPAMPMSVVTIKPLHYVLAGKVHLGGKGVPGTLPFQSEGELDLGGQRRR